MNHTLRDILWWLPMWTAMGVGGYYLHREGDRLGHSTVSRCVIGFAVLYFLWPIIGAVLFTYG